MARKPSRQAKKKAPATKSKAPPKQKAAARSAARKAKAKAKAAKPSARDPLDSFIDAAVLSLRLSCDPAWLPAIKMNLEVILRQAALVDEFSLPDETEPAPVYEA